MERNTVKKPNNNNQYIKTHFIASGVINAVVL